MLYFNLKKRASQGQNLKVSAPAYEKTVAGMIYDRLCALCESKAQEFIADGTPFVLAKNLAEIYVMTTYTEGHSFAIYAVAQARLQLLREGYIPSNASTMPDPWSYDPYTRLYDCHVEAIVGMDA